MTFWRIIASSNNTVRRLESSCIINTFAIGTEYCSVDGETAHDGYIPAVGEYNKPGEREVYLLTSNAHWGPWYQLDVLVITNALIIRGTRVIILTFNPVASTAAHAAVVFSVPTILEGSKIEARRIGRRVK